MTDYEPDIRPATDDARVDNLAREFVSLKPSWSTANADYQRSKQILLELDSMGLSPWQKKQVVGFVQYHWTAAAGEARQLGLFHTSGFKEPLSQRLAGICLVQGRMNDGTYSAPVPAAQ